jgi:hypothetical protein
MGLHRITIECNTYDEAAVKVGQGALATARFHGVSVSKAEVVVHPGQDDEKTIDLLAPTVAPAAEGSETPGL